MPRIPTKTAEGSFTYPRFTSSVGGGDNSGEAALVKGLNDVAATTLSIATNLDDQEAEIQLRDANFKIKAGLKDIESKVSYEPEVIQDPARYYPRYLEEANQLYSDIQSGITNTKAKRKSGILNETYQLGLINARAEGLKLQSAMVQAKTDVQLNQLADEGASQHPGQYGTYVSAAEDIVNRAFGRKIYDAKQKEQRVTEFKKRLGTKQMQVLAATDPEELRRIDREGGFVHVEVTERLKIMEQSEKEQKRIEEGNKAAFQISIDFVKQWWWSRADRSEITEAEFQAANRGENPFIRPQDVNAYRERNAKGPLGGSADLKPFQMLLSEYRHADNTKPEVVVEYRRRFQKLQEGTTGFNKDIDTIGKILQDDYFSALREQRAATNQERSTEALVSQAASQNRAETRYVIQRAETLYDSMYERSILTGIGRRIDQNQMILDKASIATQIYNDPKTDIKKLVNDTLSQYSKNSTNQSNVERLRDALKKR